MTMFDANTPDMDKKLQEIEDEEIMEYMKTLGCSNDEIAFAIKNTHLRDAINRLEDILCEKNEIIAILSEKGWKREEIEATMK